MMHANCACNERMAVVGRVLVRTPKPTDHMCSRMMLAVRLLGSRLVLRHGNVVPWTFDEFIQRQPPSKRRLYSGALEVYKAVGVRPRDTNVRMFVKAEKMDAARTKLERLESRPGDLTQRHLGWGQPDAGDIILLPRAIQHRSPVFNLAVGVWLKPMEKLFYAAKSWGAQVREPSRLIAKGLNQTQRAQLLIHKLDQFTQPVVVTMDASSFDAHVSVAHLKLVHGLYRRLSKADDFLALLGVQLNCSGLSNNGLSYGLRGKRCSGDMDTALGNCIVMIAAVQACMVEMDVNKYELLNDGDDCLLVVEERVVGGAFVDDLRASMLCAGFQCKAEICYRTGSMLEDITFCRSKPVNYGTHYCFVRDAARALSTFLVSHKNYGQRNALSYIKDKAVCELAVSAGLPIHQALAVRVLEVLGTVRHSKGWWEAPEAIRARLEVRRPELVKAKPVQSCTRFSYARAFGVDLAEQLRCEAYYTALVLSDFNPHGAVLHTDGYVDHDRVLLDPSAPCQY